MKNTLLLSLVALSGSVVARAQAPTLYNTLSGVVWIDADSNNVRGAGERVMPGILVTLVRPGTTYPQPTDSIVSSALTDANGAFTLKNYLGAGTYYVNYVFPSAGYDAAPARAGSDNSINSAADPDLLGYIDMYTVSTPQFTISGNTSLNTFGFAMYRNPRTLTYWSTQPMSSTSWSNTFRLPKSNNNVATANRVSILVNEAAVHPTIGVENTGLSPDAGFVRGSSELTMTLPAGSVPMVNTAVVKNVSFSAWDGTTDFGGTSGNTWDSSYGAAHNIAEITVPALLTPYRTTAAPDSISIQGNAVSATTITGSANLVATISTVSGAGVFVTYTYPAIVPLQLKLLSFSGRRNGNTAVLSWDASSTAAGEHFVIERSTDGASFAEVGTVPANKGRNGSAAAYRFTDEAPAQGVNYYRLKLLNNDGTPEYSSVSALSFGNASTAAASPNPASSTVTITAEANSRVSLQNAVGQTVRSFVMQESGKAVLPVGNLPAGIYTLRIEQAGNSQPAVQRLVIRQL